MILLSAKLGVLNKVYFFERQNIMKMGALDKELAK